MRHTAMIARRSDCASTHFRQSGSPAKPLVMLILASLSVCVGCKQSSKEMLSGESPDHHRHVRLRVCASVSGQASQKGGITFRHQPDCEPLVHADFCRTEERAAGGDGCRSHVGHACLDDVRSLAALSLGGRGSSAVFRLGDNRRGAARKHCGDELLKEAS